MKQIHRLLQQSSSIFFLLASAFIVIFILDRFFFFSWLYRFILVLKPLWIGIILAFFMQPLIHSHQAKKVTLVYLGFVSFFVLLFGIIFYLFFVHASSLMKLVNEIVQQFDSMNFSFLKNMDIMKMSGVVVSGYEWFMPFFTSLSSFFMTFFLSVLIAYFISLESQLFVNEFKKYVKNYLQYFYLYDIFSKILRQYIRSTLLDMIYIILSTSIILYFFKTPHFILLAILLAFLNLFPYVGALIGSVVLLLIHLLAVKENTLYLLMVLVINSQFESNVIHTWICHKTMRINPLFLFIALLVNEFFFGVVGVILSPIMASIFQLGMTAYGEYLNQKNVGGWEKM